MKIPPCKDCPQRTAECHGSCVNYARWRAQNTRPPCPDAEYRQYVKDNYRPRRCARSQNRRNPEE